MKQVKKKLRSRRGMSLSEVLVALLILSLVTVGVATGVNASLRIYRQSVALSDAQTLSSTLSEALMDELRYARNISDGAAPTFTSVSFGEGVAVRSSGGYIIVSPPVREMGDDMKSWPLLVGTGAYAGHLTAEADVDYTGGVFAVTLNIYDSAAEGSAPASLRTVEFSVRPLNQ